VFGLEISFVAPHLAHAIVGGPYSAVDSDGDGVAVVHVDGTLSHTHAPDRTVIGWTWKVDGQQVGTGAVADVTLPAGEIWSYPAHC
jgi:hypothetical protein